MVIISIAHSFVCLFLFTVLWTLNTSDRYTFHECYGRNCCWLLPMKVSASLSLLNPPILARRRGDAPLTGRKDEKYSVSKCSMSLPVYTPGNTVAISYELVDLGRAWLLTAHLTFESMFSTSVSSPSGKLKGSDFSSISVISSRPIYSFKYTQSEFSRTTL